MLRKISCRISQVMFDIVIITFQQEIFLSHPFLREIFQSHSFLLSQKLETYGCQWYGVKRIKSIFAYKKNIEKRFKAPLYYLK